MAKPFSVVVTDPINVDLNVFRYWLQGFNVTKATRERLQHEPEVTKLFKDYSHLLHSETEEMYKRFHSIEPYLHSPTTFLNQSVYQVCLIRMDIDHYVLIHTIDTTSHTSQND